MYAGNPAEYPPSFVDEVFLIGVHNCNRREVARKLVS